MRRLGPLDKALVLILVPLWVTCFALGVRMQIRGVSGIPLGLSVESPDQYPVLTGEFNHRFHPSDPLAESGLRAGDRLIRLGDVDLRGVGTLGFFARSADETGHAHGIPLVFERSGERRQTELVQYPPSFVRPLLAASFALAASALFLLLSGRPTRTVRAWFYFGMCWAFSTSFFAGSRLETYLWVGVFVASTGVFFPLAVRFMFEFPDDRAPAGRWHGIWPWFLSIPFGFSAALMFSTWMSLGEVGTSASAAAGTLAALLVAARKYRGAEAIARRQMKWVLFGAYCASLPILVSSAVSALEPRASWLLLLSFAAVPLLPLSIVISVIRYNLFDIDRILSAAASYNLILVGLGAGVLVAAPRMGEAASRQIGIDPLAGQIVLAVALAALVVPAHRFLRPRIDRVFFKERYALDRGIAELLARLSSCSDARDLTEQAGAGLHGLLRPQACVVYAGAEQAYAPVFVEGRAVPPAFEPTGPLISTLRKRRSPLSLSDVGRLKDEAPLGPFDRAALETLQAEVVVPVQQEGDLAAFLCLGPKHSGDVYTSTDLALLRAVSESVSQELRRFDQQETVREAREMQESLRRYVPGAVAEQLPNAARLAPGEREVSVLFVDIRGYMGFAESRRVDEVFSTINRYTEKVSQIVQEHAGNVVEFNGDGMMAVFGAPRNLAHKERAAVEAGREIVDATGNLPVEGADTRLSVGVGIATGEAFVGNIQAVDRMIWSAIGKTTNLAARLQDLTRELDATVVIDHVTWERAESAASGFERHANVMIRGRREALDVHALPATSDSR